MGHLTMKPPSLRYPAWVVAVLLLAYIISFMDRMVLSLLVDPVRMDLGLSDTAISVLIGFGFIVLYTTAGLALGRIADSGDRRRLILIGMTVWCIATAASGFALGFTSLLLARIAVGIGEAALSPASYSLIASYFPRERLALATSVYALGTVVGAGVATWLIGLVSQLTAAPLLQAFLVPGTDGWRTTFFIVGLLGLPVVLLIFTVREPRRAVVAVPAEVPTLRQTLLHLRAHSSVYGGIIVGYAIMTITSFGTVLWAPSYFIRVHGFDASSVGSLFGLVMGIGGTAGVLLGGVVADALARRGSVDAAPRVVIASLVLQTPLFAFAYLLSDTRTAIGFFASAVFVMALQGGLQATTLQLLAPERMRGLVIAIYLMVANMVGMGAGPLIIALLTEHVFGARDAIGKSLAIASAASSLVAAVLVWRTLPAVRRFVLSRREALDPVAVAGTPSAESRLPRRPRPA